MSEYVDFRHSPELDLNLDLIHSNNQSPIPSPQISKAQSPINNQHSKIPNLISLILNKTFGRSENHVTSFN